MRVHFHRLLFHLQAVLHLHLHFHLVAGAGHIHGAAFDADGGVALEVLLLEAIDDHMDLVFSIAAFAAGMSTTSACAFAAAIATALAVPLAAVAVAVALAAGAAHLVVAAFLVTMPTAFGAATSAVFAHALSMAFRAASVTASAAAEMADGPAEQEADQTEESDLVPVGVHDGCAFVGSATKVSGSEPSPTEHQTLCSNGAINEPKAHQVKTGRGGVHVELVFLYLKNVIVDLLPVHVDHFGA